MKVLLQAGTEPRLNIYSAQNTLPNVKTPSFLTILQAPNPCEYFRLLQLTEISPTPAHL